MARSKQGNLRGAAARTDRADRRNELLASMPIDAEGCKRIAISLLMNACQTVEGSTFGEWWITVNTLPTTDQAILLCERIKVNITGGEL